MVLKRERKKRPPIIKTGLWIRDHLMTVGEDYTYRMWQDFVFHLKSVGEYVPVTPYPSYQSFARYVWILKKIGLIEPTRIERSISGRPRQYYRIRPGMEYSKAWENPQKALYGDKVVLGRRRYRKKILKLPPRPVGRPRKGI